MMPPRYFRRVLAAVLLSGALGGAAADRDMADVVSRYRQHAPEVPAILLWSQSAGSGSEPVHPGLPDSGSEKMTGALSSSRERALLKRQTKEIARLQRQLAESKAAAATVTMLKQQLERSEKRRQDAEAALAEPEHQERARRKQDSNAEVAGLKQQMAAAQEAIHNRDAALALMKAQHQQMTDSDGQLATLKKEQAAEKTLLDAREKLIAEYKLRAEKQKAEQSHLQQQVSQQESDMSMLQMQLSDVTGRLVASEGKVLASQNAVSKIQTRLDQAEKQAREKDAALVAMKKSVPPAPAGADLSEAGNRRGYAVGVSLGKEMLRGLVSRERQGMALQYDVVQQGIRDAFNGKLKLDNATIRDELSADSQALAENINRIKARAEAEGAAYRKKFARQKGVKTGDGIWYRTERQGKGQIGDGDTVAVRMTESLPDGTVTADMSSGKPWVQPLENYPAVFREVLSALGEQGEATLVVAPERAYGDAGQPPKIPPGATLIYHIRVEKVSRVRNP